MIDRFLRKLVYKEWEIRGRKIGFLDILLLFFTILLGILIRITLGEGSLEIVADFVCALLVGVVVRKAGEIRKGCMAFAVMVFQPLLLINGAVETEAVRDLSYVCPNIYQIIGMERFPQEYEVAGFFFTLAIICIGIYYLIQRKVDITCIRMLKLALFCCMTITYFMPNMQVSWGAVLVALSVALAFCQPRKFYVPLVITCCYFACQTYLLTGSTMVPLYVYSFLMLVLLADVGADLYREIERSASHRAEREEQQKKKIPYDVIFLIAITILGLLIRYAFKDVESMDYRVCLKPWVDEFKAVGTFKAIAGDFYNYTPPYMYILYGISRLPIEPLYPIKLVSVFFDFLLAYFSAKIVFELTKSTRRSVVAYGMVFCLPTVAVNSGLWGQCDGIYVTCIVASPYFILKERSHLSMLWFGMAFALKLQSLFVFPLYVFLWVRKKYRIEQFLYIPMVYLLMCIPSALAGKSIRELLLVYVEQGNTEPWMLSWNWPNIYLLFGPTNFYETYSTAGVIGTLAVLMLVLYYMVKKGIKADQKMILKGMLMFALLVPFFLPYMHERYGYLADVLAILLFVVCPSKFYIASAQILLSYTAYTGYLHGQSTVPQTFYCFVMTVVVIAVTIQVLFPEIEKDKALTRLLFK